MMRYPKKRNYPSMHFPSMPKAKNIPQVVTSMNRSTKEVEACLQGNTQKVIAQDPEIRKNLGKGKNMICPPLLLTHIQKHPKGGKRIKNQNPNPNNKARKQKKANLRKKQKKVGNSSSMWRLPKIQMKNLNYHLWDNLKQKK